MESCRRYLLTTLMVVLSGGGEADPRRHVRIHIPDLPPAEQVSWKRRVVHRQAGHLETLVQSLPVCI